MFRLAVALSFVLPAVAHAQDRQYRELELSDGRQFRAEVLATEATGLRMRVPQGETLVSFELLVDIRPVTEADFEAQEPVTVWIHAPEHLEQLTAVYASIPNVVVASAASSEGVPAGMAYELGECGADFTCMTRAIDNDRFFWLVTALPPLDESTAQVVLRGRSSGGSPIELREIQTVGPDAFWMKGHEVIGLIADRNAPKAVREAFGDGQAAGPGKPKGKSGRLVGTLVGGLLGGALTGGLTYVAANRSDGLADGCGTGSSPSPCSATTTYAGVMGGLGLVAGGLLGFDLGGPAPSPTSTRVGFNVGGRF